MILGGGVKSKWLTPGRLHFLLFRCILGVSSVLVVLLLCSIVLYPLSRHVVVSSERNVSFFFLYPNPNNGQLGSHLGLFSLSNSGVEIKGFPREECIGLYRIKAGL